MINLNRNPFGIPKIIFIILGGIAILLIAYFATMGYFQCSSGTFCLEVIKFSAIPLCVALSAYIAGDKFRK